jgi:hypothetical protein
MTILKANPDISELHLSLTQPFSPIPFSSINTLDMEDNQFGEGIAKYRQNIRRRYNRLAAAQGLTADPAKWFGKHRKEIEVPALNPFAQAASLKVLAEFEQAPDCIEALGALNRWPGRTGVPIEEYFRQWEASCAELQANPQLPRRLREMWRIGQRQRVGRPGLRRSSAR